MGNIRMQVPPTPPEDDEASIPTEEHVRNGPNLSAGSRKAKKRALPWNLTARDIFLVPPPRAEDIQETKRPRLEKPFST
jgi:hypothetical protein